jgi:Tol biopolymer transport system component
MRGNRVAFAIIVIAAVLGPHPVDGQGRGVPAGVAFSSMRDGNAEIYTMDGDGGNQTRITYDPSIDTDPAISPNGQDIVFTSNRTGNNEIFLIGSHGGSALNLTGSPGIDGWARWSPNGQQVVFHSNRDGNFEIYLMESNGLFPRRLTNYAGIDQYPDWSPNGKEIVFRRDADIYVMELESGDLRRLTNAPPVNQMATWSPNGKQIAFMSSRAGYLSVFLMNADGSDQVNLTPKDPADSTSDWLSRAPSWSTDGRSIYFMSFRPATGGDTEVFIMNADGNGLRRLTFTIGVDGSPHVR